MEQLKFAELNSIFEVIIHKYIIGLMIDGKFVWLQDEDRNENINIAMIIRKQFFTSVFFKVILEAISLIVRYKTTCWLELEYSLTFTTSDAHSIFILLTTMDWYLEVKIWAEDKRCSSCLLIQEIYWLLCTTSREIHAQCMEEASRCGIFGRYWSCDQRRINILSNKIECNDSRNTSSPLHSKSWKIENWRSLVWKTIFVSSTTTKNLIQTRPQLDSRNDQSGFSVEQQPVGKLVQQFWEKHLVLNLPNQPNPNPIQSVIERGNPWRWNVFLWRKEKRPIHKRLLVNVCKKNLVLQIERGNLWSVKTIASWMFTIERGNPWNQAHTHNARIWFSRTSCFCIFEREQVQPCNRRRKHRLQHLKRAERDGETITWHQRSQLDSADRESPSTTSTSMWTSTTSSIQFSQQRIKRCDCSCWEHWTMRDSLRGAEITV